MKEQQAALSSVISREGMAELGMLPASFMKKMNDGTPLYGMILQIVIIFILSIGDFYSIVGFLNCVRRL